MSHKITFACRPNARDQERPCAGRLLRATAAPWYHACMKTITTTRKTVRAGDIPRSWAVDLPDDPEAPVTVLITPAGQPSDRRLVDFIGAGKGVYGTREEADTYLHDLRDEWRS